MSKWIWFTALIGLAACAGDDTEPVPPTGDTGEAPPDTGLPIDDFAFADDPATAYVRVDRMGMPAINTAVITSKDAYNAADPTDDASGTFVTEITDNLTALHAGVDASLMSLSLTPCAVSDCVAQAAPLVVPDHLTIDPSAPAGFPNGRTLPDPVMDVTLAVVLLDLNVHAVDLLASLPLNPPANDKAFEGGFPYLATPH